MGQRGQDGWYAQGLLNDTLHFVSAKTPYRTTTQLSVQSVITQKRTSASCKSGGQLSLPSCLCRVCDRSSFPLLLLPSSADEPMTSF